MNADRCIVGLATTYGQPRRDNGGGVWLAEQFADFIDCGGMPLSGLLNEFSGPGGTVSGLRCGTESKAPAHAG